MEYLLYLCCFLSFNVGLSAVKSTLQSRNFHEIQWGLVIGGCMVYWIAAVFAVTYISWWPLLIGLISAQVIGVVGDVKNNIFVSLLNINVISSFRKSSQLKAISIKLAETLTYGDPIKRLKEIAEKKIYLQQLFDISFSFDLTKKLLEDNHKDRDYLEAAYSELCLHGAEQYVNGHYIAASSFVFKGSLEAIITAFDGKKFRIPNVPDENCCETVVKYLIHYFR